MDEGDDLGLSRGEMLAEETGVESVVAIRRRIASLGKAVVAMVLEGVIEDQEGRRYGRSAKR